MNRALNLPRLSDALLRAGMNQSALAARLKVSREAVSNWMRGESLPQPDKLVRIAKLVGLTFDELVQRPPPGAAARPRVTYPRTSRSRSARVAEAPAKCGAPGGAIELYRAPDGTVSLEVRLDRETIWLSQREMAVLFSTERSVITKHLRNIFATHELEMDSVCAEFAHTAADGKQARRQEFDGQGHY